MRSLQYKINIRMWICCCCSCPWGCCGGRWPSDRGRSPIFGIVIFLVHIEVGMMNTCWGCCFGRRCDWHLHCWRWFWVTWGHEVSVTTGTGRQLEIFGKIRHSFFLTRRIHNIISDDTTWFTINQNLSKVKVVGKYLV